MGEWADQVHFLYCVAWAGFSAILVRPAAGWECPVEREFWVALAVAVLVLVAGIVHHFRYLQCEKRVFEEDAKE